MKNKMFRRAVGGFNREDVTAYIAGLAEDHKRETAALKKSIDVLEQKNKSLEEIADPNRMERLSEENARLNGDNALLKAQNSALSAKTDRLRHMTGEAKTAVSGLSGIIDKMNEAAADQDADPSDRPYSQTT